MATLTAHLRTPDDHGRLAFHPECPVCRGERLAGALPREGLVSRRAEAVLAAGVLAVSSATPTAALAQDPDQEYEGAAAPEQVAAAPHIDPGFEPGGQATDLPFDAAPEPSVPPAQDPIDDTTAEPPANDEPPADGAADPVAAPPDEPPASEPVPAPPEASPTEASPSVPVAETPAAPEPDASAPPRVREREATHETERPTELPAPVPSPDIAYVPVVSTAPPAPQLDAPTPAASATQGQAARRGDRFHVVRRGESLWSIASDLAGDGASPAQIARVVNRLWELNSTRIGTGDPDLLLTDTRLVLR